MTAFDDFWTASSLTPANRDRFLSRIADFADPPPPHGLLPRSGEQHPLPRPRGSLARLMARRRSARAFDDRPLRSTDLAALLAPLAENAGRRAQPAAGDLHTIAGCALLLRADHPLQGRVVTHAPRSHALHDLGPVPPWADLDSLLAASDLTTPPAVVLLLVADTERVVAKYGERGGRFALIEAGAVLQSISLVAADRGLACCALGGSLDDAVLDLVGLDRRRAKAVLTIAVGRGR